MGEEAIAYAMAECDAVAVFTTQALLPKVASAIKDCPKIKNIIYYSDLHEKSDEKNQASDKVEKEFTKNDRKIYSFEALVEMSDSSGWFFIFFFLYIFNKVVFL